MRGVFWGSAFVIVYVYLLYPVLIGAWAAIRRGRVRPTLWHLPTVSIVIAARNEARSLPRRLRNLLAMDYPPDRVEIIVVSDGSTDDTVAVAASFGKRVRAFEVAAGGKANALNAGCAAARHDVLVFTDARQRFAKDALRWLVAPLGDPSVGGVTGEMILDCETRPTDSTTIGESLGAYWRYEKWLRRHESAVWSTLGATGCIYALRRTLWQPLPAGTLLDDVLAPMRAVLKGFRIVFEPRARAFDCASPDAAAESRRKVRTLAGNFQILAFEPRLLVPFANPVWLQYVSHKIGRLVVPYAMGALLISSVALSTSHMVYAAALAGQLAIYALAVYGAILERRETSARAVPRAAIPAVEHAHLRPPRVRSHA
jgi:cellulose synthase/poly-beta-1,6-N-acetylglucosamine synthase-like glycosyltransferase